MLNFKVLFYLCKMLNIFVLMAMALEVFSYMCDVTSPCFINTMLAPRGESCIERRQIEKLLQWSR